MNFTTLWLGVHRDQFVAFLGFCLWVFASYWYLRRDIKAWRRNSRGHSWVADMATKKGKGGRGPSA